MLKKESGIHFSSILYLILVLLLCLPLFVHLELLPIRLWDESRLAMNSYAMLGNHNYIVTCYDGMPDMWNTKPPLMIWIQVFFMKLLGVNEISVRLPSVLAALATCLVLINFSKKHIKNLWIGFIAAFVLISSQGFMGEHAARTGDYDALLTLLTTCSGLYFFLYCEKNQPKELYLFFVFSTLAVLTKGIAGVLFFPALLLYSVYSKQLIPLLKNRHFYIGAFSFIGLICGYYLLRESHNHGYIAAVIRNELGSRYFNALEKHNYGYLYFIKNLIGYRFSYWYLFVPFGLVVGFTHKNLIIKRIALFSFLMAFTYFLVITLSKTKLEWYDVPMYPFLSVLAAIIIHRLSDLIRNIARIDQAGWRKIIPYAFIVLLFVGPYQ
ncbi:MAG: glycosyltransferase family 39 protein [Paludibacter sp.]|nr:glycosyltransferase family 39 protein [Paludibacter sp.]